MWKKLITPAVLIALVGLFGKFISDSRAVVVRDSNLDRSPIFYESSNIDVKYETNGIVPLERTMKVFPTSFKRIDNGLPVGKIFNVKFTLPNNKNAFVDEITTPGVIIAYTNDDCSELRVTEKYQVPRFLDDDICWIAPVDCSGMHADILSGPKAIRDLESCYQM